MKRSLATMAQTEFDVLVIGGGINGTAVAKDAALRGLKVGLVEKNDFGYGTTSRSTRLIHGGLRYLELYDFALVREGLKEREILMHLAPHLVTPLPFLFPIFKGDRRGPLLLKMGMVLYDLLAGRKSVPSHRFLTREQALAYEPLLRQEGLRGAMLYYDAQVAFPERMCVEHVLSAAAAGAQIANHAEVTEFLFDGASMQGVRVRDGLTGQTYTLRAKTVVNAGGPWADLINNKLPRPSAPKMRLTKGVHLLTPAFTRHAVVLSAQQDGRIFFAIPWGDYTLVGTTDTDFNDDLDALTATPEDVSYLVNETKKVFPNADLSTIHFITSGVRPLALTPGGKSPKHESAVSRKHAIVDHATEGYNGLVTILGAKITNHRLAAEEAVDLVCKKLGVNKPGITSKTPFFAGNFPAGIDAFVADMERRYARLGLSKRQVSHLVRHYGTAAERVLSLAAANPELRKPIAPDSEEIMAQVAYAIDEEMAFSLEDVLLRRTRIGLTADQGVAVAPMVARFIGERLGRDERAIAQDIADYHRTIALMREVWRAPHARVQATAGIPSWKEQPHESASARTAD